MADGALGIAVAAAGAAGAFHYEHHARMGQGESVRPGESHWVDNGKRTSNGSLLGRAPPDKKSARLHGKTPVQELQCLAAN